MAMSQTRAE